MRIVKITIPQDTPFPPKQRLVRALSFKEPDTKRPRDLARDVLENELESENLRLSPSAIKGTVREAEGGGWYGEYEGRPIKGRQSILPSMILGIVTKQKPTEVETYIEGHPPEKRY